MARTPHPPGERDAGSVGSRGKRFEARWPAHAIAVFVGLFCLVVAAMWVRSHVFIGDPVDDTASIIAAATLLRVISILIALASVQNWGSRLPQSWVATGLWGCAAAQLIYPAAELLVKLAILADLLDVPARGVGDMSATGWLNLSMAWLIFGVPGLLFILAARSHRNRFGGFGPWPAIGVGAGIMLLLALGVAIG